MRAVFTQLKSSVAMRERRQAQQNNYTCHFEIAAAAGAAAA
jgi:hypothetical protein